MKRNLFITLLMFFSLLVDLSPAFSHGVTGVVNPGRAVIAEIRYDDGEPFSYSPAKIYSPDNDKIEYQNSRTDARGIISFVPDKKGTWRLEVSDDTGHGKKLEFNVTDTDLLKSEGSGSWAMARRQKIIMSILMIWAVVATSFYLMAKGQLKKKTAGQD